VSAFWFYPVWAFKLEKELQKTKSNYMQEGPPISGRPGGIHKIILCFGMLRSARIRPNLP